MSDYEELHIMRKNVNRLFNLLCAKSGCNDIKLFYHILKYLHILQENNRINGRLYMREDKTDKEMLTNHIRYIWSLVHKKHDTIYDICNEFNIMTIIAIEAVYMLLCNELTQFHISF